MQHVSISEAAALLQKSERQIRYMIKASQLQADKVEGRWRILTDSLPLTEAQRIVMAADAERIVAAAESTAEPARKAAGQKKTRRRFSVDNLRVFRIAMEVFRQSVETCGADAPATKHLRTCLELLARGCHTYHSRPKTEQFCAAREEAASALVELLIAAPAVTTGADGSVESSQLNPHRAIAERIEQELMGPFSGLIRTVVGQSLSVGARSLSQARGQGFARAAIHGRHHVDE